MTDWGFQVALVVRRLKRCGIDPWMGKIPWRRHGNPPRYSCLENPMDRGTWQATVHGVAKRQTQLKQLSTYTLTCWQGKEISKPSFQTNAVTNMLEKQLCTGSRFLKNIFHVTSMFLTGIIFHLKCNSQHTIINSVFLFQSLISQMVYLMILIQRLYIHFISFLCQSKFRQYLELFFIVTTGGLFWYLVCRSQRCRKTD